jgi:hypothetical protein
VIVISGGSLVEVGVGSCEGRTVAVGLVAVGLSVGDNSSDGTAVTEVVAVEVVVQAFEMSRTNKIKEGANRNFCMNTSGGKSGYSTEFWLNIASKP